MIGKDELDKKFCVYVHTNKTNGKRYVGVTSQDPEKRWENGNGYTKRQPHMYNAIQKWGWDSFDHEILIDNISAEHADSLERMLIKTWGLQDPQYGYNAQSGGLINATLPDDVKQKISRAHAGKKFSEEHKQNLSNARKNKPLSEKQKAHLEKIQSLNKGRQLTEEQKQHLSEVHRGREFSEEHKRNISNGKKGKPQSEAQKNAIMAVCEANKGRSHSSDSKDKISAGNKGKYVSHESREKMRAAWNGKKTNKVKIGQYDLDTGDLIREWESMACAKKITGINNINRCVYGQSKSAGGYLWKKLDN